MIFEARISGSAVRKPVVVVDSEDAVYDFIPEITQGIIFYDDRARLFDITINGYELPRIEIEHCLIEDGNEEEEYEDVAKQVINCIKEYDWATRNVKSFDFSEEECKDSIKVVDCIDRNDWSEY